MCGIAGFVEFTGHDQEAAAAMIRRMTDTLVHRGPDEVGYFVDGQVALGHRRLSIIDLASGQQPMSTCNGAVQIAYNGEIYNFKELRAELAAGGAAFKTNCDTEVILAAYLEWGVGAISRLNGMFAFAIWDARKRELLLARDRVGKKPLYFQLSKSGVRFASELKALVAIAEQPATIDPEALDCYFSFGYVPAPKTIYRDIYKLQPGRFQRISAGRNEEHRYWDLRFTEPRDCDVNQAADELDSLIDTAVAGRMIADVPLGAFLSGGLDSSLVVSSMSRQAGRKVRTHTIGFDGDSESEIGTAREIARHLGADHREYMVSPKAVDVLPKIAWHFDEPFADSSALPTWYVCEKTRESVTVALSGDGGDEAFGGYTFRYLPHVAESAIRARLPTWLRAALCGPLGQVWPSSARLPRPLRLKTILENLAANDAQAFYRDLIWLRDDARRAVYRPDFMSELQGFSPFEFVDPLYRNGGGIDALSRAQYTDINLYMTDDVLVKVDRMSMAHSLEVRAPLLDYRILEFAAALPARTKMNSRHGKILMREIARRRLPDRIRNLPKKGFSIPAARWLREELRPLVEDGVFAKDGIVADYLDKSALKSLWGQHLAGTRDYSVFFWGLMMFDLWQRNCHEIYAGSASQQGNVASTRIA